MDGLRDMNGLQTITRTTNIVIWSNKLLMSTLALHKAEYNMLLLSDNPKLVCVPDQWPLRDNGKRIIRADGLCAERCIAQNLSLSRAFQQHAEAGAEKPHCITTAEELNSVAACKSWDYFCITCSNCTQHTAVAMTAR